MLRNRVQIDSSSHIVIQQFDVAFNDSLHPSSRNQALLSTTLSNMLNATSNALIYPFAKSTALFTKARFVTPGRYVSFSSRPIVDKCIKGGFSLSYLALGSVGTLASSFPGVLGLICRQLAQQLVKQPYQCYVAKHKTDEDNEHFKTSKRFTFLTRNTALIPEAISNFSHLRPSDERLPELIRSILCTNEPIDALCLQEVFGKQRAQKLVAGLKGKFKYFIYDIAPNAIGLESGLFFASNHPIVCARFIRPPLPTMMKAANILGYSGSIESFTNKGILYVVIETDKNQYSIVINAHIKSNMSFDKREAKSITKIRTQGLRVLAQGLFNFIDDLKNEKKIDIINVILGGDLNASDLHENGIRNNERSGEKLQFIFAGLFPGQEIDTWLKDESREPNQAQTGYGQLHFNQEQKGVPHVCFDHTALFNYQTTACPTHDSASFHCDVTYKTLTYFYGDQGASNGKGSPASDHAGLLLEIEKSCRFEEEEIAKQRKEQFVV